MAKEETTDSDEELVYANILLNKVPNSNKDIVNPKTATDGITGSGTSQYTQIEVGTENGSLPNNGYETWNKSYLQYDFGKERTVEEIKIFRNYYPAASSLFKNVKIELSTTEDFQEGTVTTVFDAQDVLDDEDNRGAPQTIDLNAPVEAQYIRVWGQGHYIENDNGTWKGMSNAVRFAEIEVYANVPESELPEEPELEMKNIALGKTPYVYGLDPSNLEAISDGESDDNYAVHNSPGNRWLQFDFKNKYKINKINFKLEEGVNYKKVLVQTSTSPSSGHTDVWKEVDFTQDEDMVEVSFEEKPVVASHVRFKVEANTEDRITKYSEVEIWASGDDFDESRENEDYKGQRENTTYTDLVWSDEFNGDKVDETKWNIIEDMVNHGAIYNRDAVSIKKDGKDSYLSIRTKNYDSTENLMAELGLDPDTFVDYTNVDTTPSHVTWSSGRVESKNKFSFLHGRVAVRAKPNDSQGVWPAIWMLSQDEVGHDEIDILEYLGNTPYDAWSTNHFGKWGKNKRSDGKAYVSYEAWSEAFHVYEVEWNTEAITFFIDGVEVFKTTQGKELDSMHTRPFFTILETQVGDGWVGPVDYEKEVTKQDSEYLIDWVKVYQEPGANKVKFDDLETLGKTKGTDYLVSPYATSGEENFVKLTDGKEEYLDKNNFMYGGQPSYETSRISLAEGKSDQYIIYNVDDVETVHLTSYYRTISDKSEYEPSTGLDRGFSIESSLQDDENLDFEIHTSQDGLTWTKFNGLKQNNNWVDYPKRARVIWDGYNLPENTNYVKVVFSDYQGKTYKLEDGSIMPVLNTDVQLAKVTFLQKEEIKSLSANELKSKVEEFEGKEDFENEGVARSLKIHLTAVAIYEEKKLAEKVVKHMESFKMLLDYQKENELISEKAYNYLKESSENLIRKWQ